MKLLISAYACAPDHGSEHAIGWNWITEAHRLGHRVVALVAPNHRDSILRAVADMPDLAGITWIFPTVPVWTLVQGSEPRWERSYNVLWQIAALRVARTLHAADPFDLVHHLTWGGVRAPTFLGLIGAPLIVGPLGGGETSTNALRVDLSLKAKLTEFIRDCSNRTITLNPLSRRGLVDAAVIAVKTPETKHLLTRSMQAKTVEFIELGFKGVVESRPGRVPGPPRLLFAGRLLYWKGAHIAVRALAELRARIPDARLTIVGKGNELGRLKQLVARLDLTRHVEFVPWLRQEELFQLYRNHDLFVFPSMHDSSGGVVLEALSFGLPVICLDLGGPKQIVTSQCGIIVPTRQRDTSQVAAAIADEAFKILSSPSLAESLSEGAAARAGHFVLSRRLGEFYGLVAKAIAASPAPAPMSAQLEPS